jgi:hypothetical protein
MARDDIGRYLGGWRKDFVTVSGLLTTSILAVAGLLAAGCGSSSTAPSTTTPAGTAVLTLSEPATVAWSAPGTGSSCPAGSASDFTWTDTVSETAGVQATLSTVVVTVDSVPSAPAAVNKTVPARGQVTISRELCFPTTSSHSVTALYSGTDANGHAVGVSGATMLSARTITAAETSQLAGAIAAAGVPLLYATFGQIVAKVQGVSGTYTLDATQSCSGGGSVRSVGPLVVVLDSTGTTGSMTLDTLLTYANCAVNSVRLDSGPLEIKGTISAVASAVQNPVPFTIAGTHSFTLDGASGSVTFACSNSMVVDLDAFAVRSLVATGNATIQYPVGQGTATVPCQTFADAFGFGTAQAMRARAKGPGF